MKFKLFHDILKDDHKDGRKYSQGRFYLFVSFISFLAINVLLTFYALSGREIYDKESIDIISSSLKWALGTFALYVLGGKGIKTFGEPKKEIENPYGGKLNDSKKDRTDNKNSKGSFGPDSKEIN